MRPEWLWNGGYEQVKGILRKRINKSSTRTKVQAAKITVCNRALLHPQKSSVEKKVAGASQGSEKLRSTHRAIALASFWSGSSQNRKVQFARRSEGSSKAKRMPTTMEYPNRKGMDRNSSEGVLPLKMERG